MASLKLSFRLTRGGWAFLFLSLLLSAGAFNAALNMTYLLASLVIAVFLVSVVVPLWNIYGLTFRRAISEAVFAGEPFEVSLWLCSTRRTVARMVSVEEPLGSADNEGTRAARKLALRVSPRDAIRLSCVARPRSRGVYPLPRLTCSSRFPFGLAEFAISSVPEGELVVYPARGRLNRTVVSALRPVGARVGARSRTGLPDDEFRSIREYRAGDNPRRIHWRISAHRGELCVREMEYERSAPLMVLLDSRIPTGTPRGERERTTHALESAISFAAEVCRAALDEGNAVVLVGFLPEAKAIPVSAAGGMRSVNEALARLLPSEASTAEALVQCAERAGLASAWQVVAVAPSRRTAEGLRPFLRRPAARIHVAEDRDFAKIFRLTWQCEGSGHEA